MSTYLISQNLASVTLPNRIFSLRNYGFSQRAFWAIKVTGVSLTLAAYIQTSFLIMSRSISYIIPLISLLFGLGVPPGLAQQPGRLPLQSHKLSYADTVYREAMAKNDSLLLAEAYFLYGKTYEAANDLLATQRWFLKSLRILEPRGDSFKLSRLYFRLSLNEFAQDHYRETRQYAQRSMAVARRVHSDEMLERSYGVMVNIYQRDWSNGGKRPGLPTARTDSAHYFSKKVHYLVHKGGRPMELMDLNISMGNSLWWSRKDPRGLSYLKAALRIATNEKKDAERVRVLFAMFTIHLDMEKPWRAWQLLRQAEQIVAQSPFANSYKENLGLATAYRDYYLKTGKWKRAYDYSEKVHALEKDKFIADREGAVTRLGLEYETEKKEALLKIQQDELALRSANLLIQQRFLWAMGILLIVTVGMSTVFFRLYRRNKRISAHNAELVKEQNHRVKNNLQVVSSLLSLQANRLTDETARKAVEESQLRVEAMATLQRRLYDGDLLVQVNLAEFVRELVDNVLEAFGYEYLQPAYTIQPISLLADDALPLGLILNELTTNACKYAFPGQSEPIFRIACQQQQRTITLVVSDNGPGYQPVIAAGSHPQSPSTFGMRLIQMQVEQLRGSYRFTSADGSLFTLEFNI